MKKTYLFLVIIIFICCTSQKEKQAELYQFITDRIWTNPMKDQYYFSRKDSSEYLWMVFEKKGDFTYLPITLAEGTPFTNPLPLEESSFREGWRCVNYFRIEGDKLIRRNMDDVNGKMESLFEVNIGKNIVVDSIEYNTLEITNTYNHSMEVFTSEIKGQPISE